MIFRNLETDQELRKYVNKTEENVGVRFPVHYFKSAKVVGCFDDNGDMIGGYALILTGPFRVLESIPSKDLNPNIIRIRNSKNNTCEITGLWISTILRKKRGALRFWFRLLRDLILSKKRLFIYAYSLDKSALGRLYSIAHPKVLFRGKTLWLPGMPKSEFESVEMVELKNIIVAPLRHPEFLIKRMIGPRGKGQARNTKLTDQLAQSFKDAL